MIRFRDGIARHFMPGIVAAGVAFAIALVLLLDHARAGYDNWQDLAAMVVLLIGAVIVGINILVVLRHDQRIRSQIEARATGETEQRVRVEEELRRSEERFKLIMELIPDVFWITDSSSHTLLYVNKAFETTWEIPREAAYANPELWLEAIHPDDRESVARNAWNEQLDMEYRVVRRDGTTRWIHARAYQIQEPGRPDTVYCGLGEDITARKKAEEMLKRSHEALEERVSERTAELVSINNALITETAERARAEEAEKRAEARMRSMLDSLDVIVWSITATPPFKPLFINTAARQIFGRPLQDLFTDGSDWSHYILEQDRADVLQHLAALSKSNSTEGEFRIERPDGEIRWLRFRAWVTEASAGEPARIDGITTDITDQKTARDLLVESEERFRLAADSAPVLICLKDAEGQCVFLNKPWLDYTGLPVDQQLGNGWQGSVHPEDRDLVLKTLQAAIQSRGEFTIDYRLRGRHGEYRWFTNRAKPRFLGDGSFAGLADSLVDVTERKGELEQQELLKGLGVQLAGARRKHDIARIVASVTRNRWGWDAYLFSARRVFDGKFQKLMWTDLVNGSEKEWIEEGSPQFISPLQSKLTHQPLLINRLGDIESEPEFDFVPFGDTSRRSRSLLFGAIHSEMETIGVVTIQSYSQNFFSEADAQLFQKVIDAAAPALQRCLVEEEIAAADARFRALTETTRDAIVAADSKAAIILWNAGAENMFGYSAQEAGGRHVSFFLSEKKGRKYRTLIDRTFRTEGRGIKAGRPLELYGRRRDGTDFPIELSLSSSFDRGNTYITAIIRDITQRKETDALEGARFAAEQANQTKNQFLSRMSHELRTPMNAVIGFARLLEMDGLNEEQRENTREILKAGRHLLALINEVLDISKIEAGQLTLSLEPVRVDEVVGEACALLSPIAAQHGVTLHCGAEHLRRNVFADKQRLKQVLLNLIGNAIKYNSEAGKATVACIPVGPDRHRISVIDTGPGIPAENIPRLFQPFDRLGAESTEIEGSGLGLALSRRLAELMSGEIGVQSTVGEGSTFWIELPAAEENAAFSRIELTPVPGVSDENGRAGSILYIEDNLSNLRLVEKLLSHRPAVRLVTAMQGQMGLDLAREIVPQLILLDLNLPDIHGGDVLKRLRDDGRTQNIPVIVISADATAAQIERLLAAGARAYITKPFNVQDLLNAIDEVFTCPS